MKFSIKALGEKEKKLQAEEHESFHAELKHVKRLAKNAKTPEARKALMNLAYYIIVQYNRTHL